MPLDTQHATWLEVGKQDKSTTAQWLRFAGCSPHTHVFTIRGSEGGCILKGAIGNVKEAHTAVFAGNSQRGAIAAQVNAPHGASM